MTRFKLNRKRHLAVAAVTASLSMAFTLSVSPAALAACSFSPGPAATAGNDVVECDDAHGTALNLQGGNDKLTVNDGAVLTGGTGTGGVGNDLMVINGGEINVNLNPGTGNNSLNDTDRMFVFGGTFNDIELQSGSGTDNFVFLMGGEMEAGGIEVNRGSTGATIVFDGMVTSGTEVFEFQNGNGTTNAAARSPTFYFRSGSITAEEMEFGANDSDGVSRTDVTVIFDPVNSKSREYFEALANGADAGSLGTETLLAAIANAPSNPDGKMILNVPEIEFGGGNDTLVFEGAVNTGEEDDRNLFLNGEEEEPGEFETTEIGGGAGEDRLIVRGASRLSLGEIEDFEHLAVTGGSKLTLGDNAYEFEESVTVDGTSVLHLSNPNATLTTEHFELQAGNGLERLAGLPSYYSTFASGGVLQIGALPGAAPDDDDDDDDAPALLAAAEDDDDDDDDDTPSAGANVTINTGASTFVNNGTITMLNNAAGDTLTVNGPYVSVGGNLAIDAALGDDGSPTDKLVINGTVTGTTIIYVNNVGGAGGLTTGGIEIVESDSDAFTEDSFRLAVNALSGREEVIAGPYSYRLEVTDDEALLQSDLLDQVPAYATAPSVGQRLVAGGLDTLYKRLGEIRGGHNDGATSSDGLMWVRGHYADVDVDAKQGFDFSQRSSGVMAGIGGTIAGEGRSRLAVGAFGGYSTADAGVDAVIFGAGSSSSVDADAWSFGGYATFYEAGRAGIGLYIDSVIKADFIDFDMTASGRASKGSTDGDAFTGSAEIGYGFAIGNGFVLQPQAQIAYTDLTVNSFDDGAYGLAVSYGSSESLVGRLGLQIQANWAQPGGGFVSPYAIFNVYQEFEGSSQSEISGVDFTSDVSGTWYSAGGGINAQLANNVSLYGAGEYHFGDLEGWQGTGGVKLNW